MSLRGALIRNSSSVPLVSKHSPQYSIFSRRRNHDDVLMQTYENVGTVFAIVHSLAVATAKLDWHLYRSSKSGMKEDRVEVTSHACVDLWQRPNPVMPRRRFVETAQQHIDLTGESDILTSSARIGSSRCRTRTNS
jgi:phage portal protein BeeE